MNKSQAIRAVNIKVGANQLTTKNTTFASLKEGRSTWWMNIKLKNFHKDWNILLVGEGEIKWLFIPADTFKDLPSLFRIWDEKKAVDIYISSDKGDRYLQDIASGSAGVDFRQFLKKTIPISEDEELMKRKTDEEEVNSHLTHKSLNPNLSVGQIILHNGQTNISYHNLFAGYMEGAGSIILQDPYIRHPHQYKNLLEFCLMLGKLGIPKQGLNLELVTWNVKEFLSRSKTYFDEVAASVRDLNIHLTYKFEEHHDRFIRADNGWKIVLGRGLDIFHKPESRYSIADIDQTRRKCKACEITYLKQ